jgi:hypothetical protein
LNNLGSFFVKRICYTSDNKEQLKKLEGSMQWEKKLSRSDAQQKTKGRLMPFRFTGENCPGNPETWFRNDFFQELHWNSEIRVITRS